MSEAGKQVAVSVKGLSKTFRIPTESSNGLKQGLINVLKGKKGYREFTPLKDITFDIEEGDFFGIVGRNGSGKSTLLKSIANIYNPTSGSVQVNGTLVPFIELGVGFNPELTGRENVFLNGALLGFSHAEMEKMYDEIVEFAEIKDFMEEKLKNYSSGMQVRLAFSIAIKAQGDILLLDEVLAVGDESFQRKCYSYFSDLKKNGKTVILVTHDMSAIERYCNKALMIEKGRIVKQGSNIEVAEAYRELFLNSNSMNGESEKKASKQVEDAKIEVLDEKGVSAENIKALTPFSIKISYDYQGEKSPGAIGVSVRNSQGLSVIAVGTGTIYDEGYTLHKGVNTIEFKIDENVLTNDTYTIDIGIAKGEQNGYQELIYQQSSAVYFRIHGIKARPHSLTHPKVVIKENHEPNRVSKK